MQSLNFVLHNLMSAFTADVVLLCMCLCYVCLFRPCVAGVCVCVCVCMCVLVFYTYVVIFTICSISWYNLILGNSSRARERERSFKGAIDGPEFDERRDTTNKSVLIILYRFSLKLIQK